MRASILAMAAAAAILGSASASYADTASGGSGLETGGGWYLSGEGGLPFLENAQNSSPAQRFDASGKSPGYEIGGALGRDLGNGFRIEGELAYRQISLDHIVGYGGLATGPAGGNANAFSVMGNGYYDFETGSPLKPYVGAGIGFARVAYGDVTSNGTALVDDSDTVFAYQGIGGVGYDVSPTGTVFTQYRYFATLDPSFTAADGQSLKSQFADDEVEVGYRLRF